MAQSCQPFWFLRISVIFLFTSAAAVGSNDTVVNYIAQELVFGGKIKIRLIQD